MNARFATPQTTPDSTWEMPLGVILSIALHLLVALLAIFGLPFMVEPPPPVEESVPVDLVPLGETTTSAPPKAEQQQPVEKPAEKPPEPPKPEAKVEPPKPEPPKPEPPKEEPKPEPPKAVPPPPPPAPTPPPPEPKAEVPLPSPERKPEPPKETPKPPDQLAEVKPQKKPPPPPDDFQSLLKTIDKMKPQPQKTDDLAKAIDSLRPSQPTPPAAQPQQQAVAPSLAPIPDRPSASEISIVQAQIERHWNFDVGARDAANLVVQVKVALLPDGTVARADIVSDPRYDSDSFYRSAADSARRAVLAASPLNLPPNSYDKFKEITFSFDPRNAVR